MIQGLHINQVAANRVAAGVEPLSRSSRGRREDASAARGCADEDSEPRGLSESVTQARIRGSRRRCKDRFQLRPSLPSRQISAGRPLARDGRPDKPKASLAPSLEQADRARHQPGPQLLRRHLPPSARGRRHVDRTRSARHCGTVCSTSGEMAASCDSGPVRHLTGPGALDGHRRNSECRRRGCGVVQALQAIASARFVSRRPGASRSSARNSVANGSERQNGLAPCES